MKNRILLLTLACLLIFTSVSCSTGANDITESPNFTTSLSPITKATESSTALKDSIGTMPPPLEATKKGDLSLLFHSASAVVRDFFSIENLETYIYTDSRNPADYSQIPEPNFSDFIPGTVFQDEYIPLETMFCTNTAWKNAIRSVSMQSDSDATHFMYLFNNCLVTVTCSPQALSGNSTTDYFEAYKTINLSFAKQYQFYNDLSAIKLHEKGYVTRSIKGYDIVYHFEESRPISLFVIVDSYMVEVTRFASIAPFEDSTKAFQDFMTQPSTAPVAALFSEDDQVFEAAVTRIVTAIRAKTLSLSEATN